MPLFTDTPPNDANQHGFRLLRTPASPPFRAYVISENLIGCPTHYVQNRTIPCEKPNCEPCINGITWRWHGYLLVLIEATTEIAIFETTAAASKNFKEYYQRHGTTRGCYFQATRVNGRSNGRVLIQCKPADLAKIHLPEPLDLRKLLCHIWNIAPNQVTPADRDMRPPAQSLDVDRNRPEIYTPKESTIDPVTKAVNARAAKGNGKTAAAHPPKP